MFGKVPKSLKKVPRRFCPLVVALWFSLINSCRSRFSELTLGAILLWGSNLGHTPSPAGTFRKNFRKNSGKTPEMLSELFLEFPSRVRLGSPKPYNSRYLGLPEHFQNCLPPSTAGGASFFQNWFRRGPLRAGHGNTPSSTGGISGVQIRSLGNP